VFSLEKIPYTGRTSVAQPARRVAGRKGSFDLMDKATSSSLSQPETSHHPSLTRNPVESGLRARLPQRMRRVPMPSQQGLRSIPRSSVPTPHGRSDLFENILCSYGENNLLRKPYPRSKLHYFFRKRDFASTSLNSCKQNAYKSRNALSAFPLLTGLPLG
jgi:hypothetical protein